MRAIRCGLFLLLLACVPVFQGCAFTWTGRSVPWERLNELKPGSTTPSEVEKIFGPPEDIVYNSIEDTTVYLYRARTNVFVGLPTPGLTIGKTKQGGYAVNISFKGNRYVGYELTHFNEKIF